MVAFHVIIIITFPIRDSQSGFTDLPKDSWDTYSSLTLDLTTFTVHRERRSEGLNVTQQGNKESNKNLFLPVPDPGEFFVTEHRHVHLE